MPSHVSIMLAPEHRLLASATAALLARSEMTQLVQLRLDHAGRPVLSDGVCCDVVIVDRFELAAHLRKTYPRMQVIMVVRTRDRQAVLNSIRAGAAACIDHHVTADALLDVVERVSNGDAVFEPEALAEYLQRHSVRRSTPDRTRQLSERELEMLAVMARGESVAEAAEHLQISVNTARTHVRNILVKMGARSKLEAVVIALREGRLSLDAPRS